jgi:uncharacterized protein YkwD
MNSATARKMMRSTLGLTFLLAAALLVAVAIPLARAQEQNDARLIAQLTNQDRQEHGLPPLKWNDALAAAAAAHAEWMVRERTLSHQFPAEPELAARAASAGAHFQAVAENIAFGPNPESIERGWMHSPGHRANILDPRMTAIGVAVIASGGALYVVEDFDQASESLSRSQVEQRVRELLRRQNVDASAPPGAAEQACAMNHGIPQGSNVRSIVRFETPDLSRLPSEAEQAIRGGDFRKAAVGACTPDPSQASFTRYRVAILFY